MTSLSFKPLGEVCDFYNGKAHEKAITEEGRYKVINSKFISSEGKAFKLTDNLMFPLYKGDLCLVMSDVPNGKTLAKCFLVDADETYSLNQRICAIRTDNFDLKFLYYQLNRHPFLLSFNNGENQTNLRKADILSCPLWVPPIPEQKRIVAILDQAFADIEQARAKTEQNLRNARELFESKKVNLFEKLSNTATLMPLPSVCNSIFAGGDAPKKGLYSKEKTETFNIPIYANAVKQNGLYGYTDYSRANEPSITIAARGSGTGHIELRKEPFLPIVRLIVLTPNKDIVHLEFLKHALQTLDLLRSGSAIPQLTVPMIKKYSIPVPSLDAQQTTVDELELLKESIGRVEKIYQDKTVLLEVLKKSILQKAFSGELTKTLEVDTNKGAMA